MRRLGAAALLAGVPVAWTALTEPVSFLVSETPLIRFYWTGVPESERRGRLETGAFTNIEPEDYLGPDACASCHPDKYETWQHHRHRWMNAPANEGTVVGDFTGESIDYFGGRARFETAADGRYLMKLSRSDVDRTYRVTQTIGSRFFQYYVGVQTEGPEPIRDRLYATEHVLPFGYWIDYRGWVPVVHVEKTREGEPSLIDAMQRDPFSNPAVYDYAQSCSQCHTTLPAGDWMIHRQPSFPPSPRGFAFDLDSYVRDNHGDLFPGGGAPPGGLRLDEVEVRRILLAVTRKKAPVLETASGVSCETCHYGGRVHAESGGTIRPRMFPVSPRLFIEGDDPERELARNPVNQNWTCSRCHIGDRFEYAAGMATWNSTEFSDLSNGACFLRNDPRSIRCIDCHDPHVTIGKAWSRTADEDDALCLKCHEELGPEEPRLAHTHHPAGSSGSRCMNCHMPRINEGLQDMVRTHAIFSPTNATMIEANQPNACNMCHVDRSIDWTLDYLGTWYGASYSGAELEASYEPELRGGPATLGWLESWHPTTQMVAVDVLTRARARWTLPKLIDQLDSNYMLVRQFTKIGLEEMLGVRLADQGYRFYQLGEERRQPLAAIRKSLLGSEAAITTERAPEDAVEGEIRHYRQFLRQRPESANGHYHLANALVRRRDVDDAIRHYREAIQLAPEMAAAHNNLGVAYRHKGAHEQAIEQHERALALEPESVSARLALGATFEAMGRRDEAMESYRAALRLDPESAEALYNLANVLSGAGRIDDAIEHYRSAIRIRPRYAEALNNLGILLRAVGQSEAAIEVFERAVDAAASSEPAVRSSVHANLGWALRLAGRLDEARVVFERALRIRVDSVPAQVGLAWILAVHPHEPARDPARAIRLAESAASVEVGSAEVLDVLAAAYASAGRFQEAVGEAERAVAIAEAVDPLAAAAIRERLTLYRAGRAYLEQ